MTLIPKKWDTYWLQTQVLLVIETSCNKNDNFRNELGMAHWVFCSL